MIIIKLLGSISNKMNIIKLLGSIGNRLNIIKWNRCMQSPSQVCRINSASPDWIVRMGAECGWGGVVVDRFYIALISALEQTHCARM